MDEDLKGFGERLLEKLYPDAIAGPAKEVGKLGTDLVKTARLLLAPLQFGAVFQDRLEQMIERMSRRVSDDRRIEPSAEVVGPALEKMRYLSDRSELWSMFEEVLTKSIDVEHAAAVHPAFVHLIGQLSRDEALIVRRLRSGALEVVDTVELSADLSRFGNRKIEKSGSPLRDLHVPDELALAYLHLTSLGLISWQITPPEEPIFDANRKQTGSRRTSRVELTEFGSLFARASSPPVHHTR